MNEVPQRCARCAVLLPAGRNVPDLGETVVSVSCSPPFETAVSFGVFGQWKLCDQCIAAIVITAAMSLHSRLTAIEVRP